MKQFKNQLIDGITSLIEIYKPYREGLSEKEQEDLKDLKACRKILKHGHHVIQKVKKCKKTMADSVILFGLILDFI